MKIAFCFLTYNEIIRYDIWNLFFENICTDKYIVYIHPKIINNINLYNFEYKIVKNIVFTKSKSDISIVKATIQLLKESYNDSKITHFIFLSQSCIPLYNFNQIFNIVTLFNNSIISYIDHNKKERYYNLSSTIKTYIKYQQFIKQQPNMILVRHDVGLIINNDYTLHFKNIECPDEHYFINILLYIFKRHIIKNQINFCNYDLNKTQALEFNNISEEFINNIKKHGFLFMRKVNKNSIIAVNYKN